jgi:hypothetical protein
MRSLALGKLALPFALAFAVGGVTGCYSKATAYDGRFTFAYASMVEHDNFVKPIAPGAKLDIRAFENGTQNELTMKSARSSRPGVVAVLAVKDHSVVLYGKEPGVAEIEVTAADANGKELTDKIFFHVAKPATHTLEHACTEEPEAVYVRGEEVVIHHSLATSDKRPVIGFDYAPVRVEPAAALDLEQQPQAGGYYLFRAGSPRSRVTLRSTIDEKTLSLRIVDRKDLKEASLVVGDRMLVGGGGYAVAIVRAGDAPLCNQTALTKARSLTPDVCSVTAKLDEDPDKDTNREQIARITALAFGVCKFEVTLPELAGGRGIVLNGETKIGREQYPGDGKTEDLVRQKIEEWSRPLAGATNVKDALALAVLGLWWLSRRRQTDVS